MSIYTITLRRELLDDDPVDLSEPRTASADERTDNDSKQRDDDGETDDRRRPVASAAVAARGASVANEFNLNEANWLDCSCGESSGQADGRGRTTTNAQEADNKENQSRSSGANKQQQHSSECLEARRQQLRELRKRAKEIVHSVNVTLEVAADLSQASRIVWYKNQSKQLTSSESPVLYAQKSKPRVTPVKRPLGESGNNSSSRSIKRTRSKRVKSLRSTGEGGLSVEEETTTEIEEELKLIEGGGQADAAQQDEIVCGGKRDVEQQQQTVLIEKCRQESSASGSKLTIFDLQDEDYGQYTCRLIDSSGRQLADVETKLKQAASCSDQLEEEASLTNQKSRAQTNLIKMDEVIEVKEGDLNIELGIQILPETNEDEELMSEEEKKEFIENTTISWFKDDVKLNQQDAQVLKLFQFTYDQVEGFHRLIVRKATKETEGVYTCLVENESGTSSCTTQLVVGPGNKPKLTSQLQDVTVYVGQSLEFRIKSTGLPPIDSCQWFKDDELLIELSTATTRVEQQVRSRHNERVSMSRSEEWSSSGDASAREDRDKVLIFRLCIDSLKLDDTGRYKCRINNEYGYDESACFVKVLQEIIEEHEEIEETIEETLRLGGGKKSTREEQEEVTTETLEQETKRQKQDDDTSQPMVLDGGQAPRFRRKLENTSVRMREEETTTTTTTEERELIVSTERDEWSGSRDQLKIRWLVDGHEISETTTTWRVDTHDESISYKAENFFDESSQEIKHKLIVRYRRAPRDGEPREIECAASNQFGETKTRSQLRWARKPRFVRQLEDTETQVSETVVLRVTVEENESSRADDLRLLHDNQLVYSSKRDGVNERKLKSNSKSRVTIRSYEETVEVEEEQVEEENRLGSRRYSRRTSSSISIGGARRAKSKRRCRTYEVTIENVQVDQQGTWECQAENEAGQVSCRGDLEVFAEPRIVTDLPEETRVQPGKEIRLTVEASGSPTPVYSWFKDGMGIAEEEDRVFTKTSSRTSTTTSSTTRRRSSVTSMRTEDGVSISGETLIIRDARPEDAGTYQCKVENRLGQVESRKSVMTVTGHGDDLRGAPRIIKDLNRVEIDEGETILLKVLADGHPKPSQHWYKNNEIVEETTTTTTTTTETRTEVEQVGQEHKMTIRRSRVDDSGQYKVVLRNELGEVESRTVEVKVNKVSGEQESQRRPSAPSIVLDSQDKVVGVGSNVSFDVQVAGHPKPLITWYKNGRRMTESGDGRVSFVEEEETVTTTTTVTDGDEQVTERKETTTVHKLVIRDVRDSDEAIYSLKAENDLGCSKSSLVSLSVDKRKDATDEVTESKTKKTDHQQQQVVEETTTTTTTTEVTEREEERRRNREAKSKREVEEQQFAEESEEELDEDGNKKRKQQTRTTRTTTTKTTTTTTEQEEEEEMEIEDEEARRRKRTKEQQVDEEEEEEETISEESAERRSKRKQARSDKQVDDVRMEVDDEQLQEDEREKRRRASKSRSRRDSVDEIIEDETIEEEEEVEERTTRRRRAPRILSAPKEVVAGLGSTPELEVEVEEEVIEEIEEEEEETSSRRKKKKQSTTVHETTTTTVEETTTTKITWLKDGQPIPDRLTRDNHIEFLERPGDKPGTKKRVMRINSLRTSDEGDYVLKVETPAGTAETAPIKVAVDRSMRPGQRASITPADIVPQVEQKAPEVVAVPEEVVAGIGSSPLIEAEVEGSPAPKLNWFKDGQPIPEEELKKPGGHLEIVDLPTDKPDVTRQALKINDLKPADAAAYHVKAENPLGEVESEPTNVRIDRSMAPTDEPIVTGLPESTSDESVAPAKTIKPTAAGPESAPAVVSAPEEIKAGPGSNPQIEAEVSGVPTPQLTWLKDGKPITDRDLRTGHVEVVDLPCDKPDTVKQALKINDLRPTDVADYQVKAENPLGVAESQPTKVKLDRLMGPRDEPQVSGPTDSQIPDSAKDLPSGGQKAPAIVKTPEEVKAGPGSSPQIEAEVTGKPLPELNWLKDGQPITDRDLRTGHVEIVDLPCDKPDTIKQALKINDLRPTDVADYQVKAENPLGVAESQPTKLKLDRSMGPRDEPQVSEPADGQLPESVKDLPSGGQKAPAIIKMPEEVKAGPGSSPQIVAEVTGKPLPELNWLKDGQPIPERDIRLGHVEIVDLPTDKPDTIKQALKVNDLRPADVAEYQVKAANPLGEVTSEPTQLKLDRSMGPRDEPKEKPTPSADYDQVQPSVEDGKAPEIVSAPEEVRAGRGGSPQIEAEVSGEPTPKLTWLKDGQPIPERDLRTGHVEVVDLPTERPDTIKQALKINDLRPTDVADYQVKAENPLGVAESQPTSVKIDRSMSSTDEPVVSGLDQPESARPGDLSPMGKKPAQEADLPEDACAPSIVSAPEEVVAGRGANPILEAEVSGKPVPEMTWYKDGQPLDEADLANGHLEVVDLPAEQPEATKKQALKINDLKPDDVAAYHVKAENPLGECESEPTNVRIDRSMSAQDEPVVTGLPEKSPSSSGDLAQSAGRKPSGTGAAPSIVSAPEEIRAGPGSKPQIEAEVSGVPTPQLTWLKDGQPITDRDLRTGHVEVVDLPCDKPDTIKQALKINDLRPTDVAEYQVKAENPLGVAESQPTKVKLDRSMGPRDEPQVSGPGGAQPESARDLTGPRAPAIVSMPKEIVAGPGSNPEIVAEVAGEPAPKLTWLKDGQPIRERQLSLGHLEIVDLPTDKPGVVKQALKVNDLRPTDAADYQVRAENPLGSVDSAPAVLKVDRQMKPRDEPLVEGLPPKAEVRPSEEKPQAPSDEGSAPKIVSLPDEVVAGPGSSPQIVAEATGKPLPELSWLKDGQSIPERDLRTGHVEVVDLPTDKPDTIKQALKVNDLRPTDVADYQVKAANPIGEVTSEPTKLKLDRTMAPEDEPKVESAPGVGSDEEEQPMETGSAPEIVSAPEEVRAGRGGSPQIEAEVSGEPTPKLSWFKDGQPIPEEELKRPGGHLELVDLPTDRPDTIKQALKINDLKPADAAAYHVKAENPLGEVESEPTNVRIDRSMAPTDEPIVTGLPEKPETSDDLSGAPTEFVEPTATGPESAPAIVSAPEEIRAGLGSKPQIEAEVSGVPTPQLTWLKDGQPITDRDLRTGHVEVVDLPCDKPDTIKQALKINDLRPTDVAEYQVKAENPLGVAESQPTKVKLDRSMGPRDEPQVSEPAGGQIPDSTKDLPSGGQKAPAIVKMPAEVKAGPGSSPQIVAEVTGKPLPELNWLKDGQPIPERDLRTGHVEIVDLPTDKPDTIKQALKVNDLRPADVADYQVKAANPLGEVTSEPTKLKLDRTMAPEEQAEEKLAPGVGDDQAQPGVEGGIAPEIVSAPEEVVAGPGSSPQIVAEATGKPLPELSWLKDGQPIPERDLRNGHVEVVDLPTDKPDAVKQALKINDLRPSDVAEYQVKAENPLGVAESQPTSIKIDRKMSSVDEPVVRGLDQPESSRPDDLTGARHQLARDADLPEDACAPSIVSAPEEVVAGRGANPVLEAEVSGKPVPEMTWFKDGQPLDEADLANGHLEVVDLPAEQPEATKKQALKINDLKPDDVAAYHVKAENPLGECESEPTNVRIDRSMGAQDEPVVTGLPEKPQSSAEDFAPSTGGKPSGRESAPRILSIPKEIKAGPGSNPQIEAEVSGVPTPQLTWLKDGQPITDRDLRTGHVEVVDLPCDKPDTIKQALKINDLRPTDVAEYQVKAENPLGVAESQPTKLTLDRSMKRADEPQVTKGEAPISPEEATAGAPKGSAPSIKRIPRKIVAPLGSNPVIEVEIAGTPKPEVVWIKDGRQVTDMRGHIALVEQPDGTHKLEITNVKAVDQGDYVIKATNALGEIESAPISLVIDTQMSPRDEPKVMDSKEVEDDMMQDRLPLRGFAPKIVRVSDQVLGELGGTVCVQVEVAASPEASVSWLVDGQQIPVRSFEEGHLHASAEKSPTKEDTTVYTLEVSALKPSDAGTYQLVAENPFGSVRSPAVSVILKDDQPAVEAKPKRKMRAPVIKRAPKQVVAREGTSPVLEVEVSGEPVPEIVWFRNGKRIERTDAHFTFEDAPEEGVYRLVVNECTKSDEANYTVQATNEAGTDESAPIELRVTPKVAGFAPQVVGLTEEVVAGAGSSPAMEVVIRAVPNAEVTWFRDGQPLDLTTRENKKKFEVTEEKVDKETVKHTLVIKDLRPLDLGAYHARAENVHGATESEPINVRIDREMGADETPVANFVEAAPQDTDEATGLGPEDSTGAQPSGKRPIRAPVIKRMPRRIVAGLGSNPTIEVVISGEPKPEVVWFKNGKRLVEVKEHVTFEEVPTGDGESTTFRVCFTSVKMTDQAEYSLVATNAAGTIDSGPIELIVDRSLSKSLEPLVMDAEELPMPIVVANSDGPIEAPAIKGLDDRVQAAPGQTVKLEAEVTGNPRPDIKWLKDGDEVELNIVNEVPGSNRHSLTLRNVNDLYDGVYSLEAKNEAGVARKEARVEIVEGLVQTAAPTEAAFQPVDAPTVTAGKRKSVDEPKEKPFIKKGLKFSQVNQGRSIKFEVQIDGKYDELVWTKDGEQINVPFEITGTDFECQEDVVMSGKPEDDDDASTLKASDDETEADLATGAPGKPKRRFPPRILMRPRNIVAGPGSRVAFEVRYEGEPRPEVIWYKNGERIKATQDGKIVLEESTETTSEEQTTTSETTTHFARLIIEDVQPEDVATYQVMLDNTYGQEKSLPVTLEIDEAMPASDDLANFSADSLPLVTDGKTLKRGRGPRILSRPRPVHAAPGSTVAFEVQVAGEPEPVVNWFRDGRIIKQTSDGHVRIEEYSNGCVRLVLSDITDADVGQYHVSAENSLGSERTIPVSLTIDETTTETTTCSEEFTQISQIQDQDERHRRGGRPPRILLRPKRLSAPQGGQVTLEVLVVGQSKPSIIWYKDGKRVEADGKRVRIEEISEGYQRLVISELTTSDAGAYTVSAENDFGVSMSQPPAQLEVDSTTTTTTKSSGVTTTTTTLEEVTTTTTDEEETTTFYEHYVPDGNLFESDRVPGGKRAPRFTVKPRNRKSPVGGRVDFEVKVSGTPKPDVVWYKNGLRVHTTPDGRVRIEEFSDGGSRLVIDKVEETDLGVYAAEASNEMGKARTEDVQLRVTQRTEVSERTERKQRDATTVVTTRTKKTRSHYTFSEERHGYVTLTINDAQLEHDGDYKLLVRNKWGEASTQAPLVVIPRVEPRSAFSADRSAASYDDRSSQDGRDSRQRRTPFDELEDYGHELDKSAGIFGSESRYQSGEDTYLLQLRDTEFPLRLRKYLRFGARQSPSLRSNLMDAHWGAGARVTIRERRKFREVMDEEIDDEKSGRDLRPTPMRLQQEVGTCNYAAAQLESLRVEAAERVARRSADGGPSSVVGGTDPLTTDMMPPFFRVKLKDAVVEESASGRQAEAVFACQAAGEPRPDYTWFRNDVIITPDVNRFYITPTSDGGSELRIRDPRLHDAGCFKCVAFNVHGNVTTRARLRVAGRPSRPEPPEYCGPVTAHEVFLQWRPPRDNIYDANCADILGYRLEMSQSSMGEDDQWQILAADIGHEFYVVDDLRPATSYTFRVSARNKFGWSDTSYSAYVTTARADQEGVPTRLTVPHEMRSRQYVSEVCDAHVLRTCEDDLHPKLNYALEQLPVSAETSASWHESYQLQAEIARGRFSIISKGVATRKTDSPDHERQVVLKFVPTNQAQAAQTKAEFDILRSLQHEKVARLYAAYRQDDAFVFVLERLSGLDVLTYLASFTQYNEETVSQIIQQVMDAIEYLHFRGMCLLELQPDNVVMTNGRTTSLKLVDFSSARFVPRSGARVPQNASQTIEYCPPEVIANHAVDTATDVWCIGVLTYVLLSGHSPFRGESEDETRENVRLGRYKYDHIYANCTPEVTRFLINVFKKHSSKRPTIEQLYENKWLLPNEFMIRKRQHATFRTDKIAAFAEEFHKMKQSQQSGELQQFASSLSS